MEETNIFKAVADAVDDLLGVKENPGRLLQIANVVMALLTGSTLYLFLSHMPSGEYRRPSDEIRFSLWPRDLLMTAGSIARSRSAVQFLMSGFVFIILSLVILVNVVGVALIASRKQRSVKSE